MISRYSKPEMIALWSDAHRYETWWRVELAAADAMVAERFVPADAIAVCHCWTPNFDAAAIARIDEIERTTRHDVLAFLQYCEEQIGEPARYLHRGLTSSDILDSALALLLVESCELIDREMVKALAAVKRRAVEHRKTPTIGRSHGIHAEPTTFGLKLAVWHGHLARARERLLDAKTRIAYGKLAGPVGTYSHLTPEVEAKGLGALGLRPEPASTQIVQRDRHAELFSAIALAGTAVELCATEVRHLMRTEVGEVSEHFGAGQQGSSAMPHKKNPILSENLCGLARTLRGMLIPALEDVALWHERDISHSSVERMIAPDATTTLHFMLSRLTGLVDGMVVDTKRMQENLDSTHGLVASGSLLLVLADKGQARQEAYRAIQRLALRAHAERTHLRPLVEQDQELGRYLTSAEIEHAFSLEPHIAHVDVIFDRVFGAVTG
jgi:adenylosuccinate lyase